MKNKLSFTLLSACLRAGFCLVLLLSAHVSHGQTVKTVSLNYSEEDFNYYYDEDSCLSIFSDILNTVFDTDINAPALPVLYVSVLLAMNQDAVEVEMTGESVTLLGGVKMSPNPETIPTSENANEYAHRQITYSNGFFPREQVELVSNSIIDGYKVASFKVFPYKYDIHNQQLLFTKNLALKIKLSESSRIWENDSDYVFFSKEDRRVRSMVINPDDFENYYSNLKPTNKKTLASNKIDYLIITSNALASEFQVLADWKTRKGVPTHVETVENILTMYPSYSWRSQRKIKQFIYDYYLAHQTDYVLLGGDYDVVPAQGCYSRLLSKKNGKDTLYVDIIPADVFYASFQGNFGWDANNNGLIGEADDGLVNSIDISITRAPVRTVYQASNFVEKVINYETNPPIDSWNNKMLSVADALDTIFIYNAHSISDALFFSDKVYQYGIRPYWDGIRVRWDGQNSDIGTKPFWMMPDEFLRHELETGYSFLDVNSHGTYKMWSIPNYFYHRDSVSVIDNYHPLVIVTSACHTNAFDNSDDPCLSEAFIRAPNSGVIAYLGSSRYGWYHKFSPTYYSIGPSDKLNRNFYMNLFSNPSEWKNYGDIVKNAKSNHLVVFYEDYTAERWLRFSLNPIGDAEMPIYVTTPKRFDNVIISGNYDSYITIDTGVDSCRVCIMDTNGGTDLYRVEENIRTASLLNSPAEFSLCISKQGYATYFCKVRRGSDGIFYLQNETILENHYISSRNVYMGSSVTNQKLYGNATIKKGRTEVHAEKTTLDAGFEVRKGAILIIK